MKKKGRGTKFIVIGLIAILVALGALAVFAQDDATPEAPVLPTVPDNNEDSADDLPGRFHKDHFRDGFNGSYHGRFGFDGARSATDEALAEALGITVEELQAAREKVAADRIAQAVEDGILTRDEANTMLAMQALKGYLDRDALLAGALGLSVEELGTARDDGTLSDLLANTTAAELHQNMQAAVETAVQQAVADNAITQQQADLVLERLQSGLEMRGEFGSQLGRPQRGFRGHGDFHGFRGAPQENSSDSDGEAFTPFSTYGNTTASDA